MRVPFTFRLAGYGITRHRLGLFQSLGVSLKTTNGLASLTAQLGQVTDAVDRWRTSDLKQRWVASALLTIEPRGGGSQATAPVAASHGPWPRSALQSPWSTSMLRKTMIGTASECQRGLGVTPRIRLTLTPAPGTLRRGSAGFMCQHVLLAAFILLWFHTVHAETVSIANMDVSREAILLEAAFTRFLRDDGYTVTGAGTDGFVVLLHGMSAQTRQGGNVGMVGSATVIKVLRRESTAALLPEGYPQASEFVGTFTAVMGSPLIYLAGTTAIGGNAEEVAQVLSIYVKTVLQHSSFRASELLRVLEQRATEHEPTRSPETGR
ncbi:MAG: hypothetical protein E6K66_09190 [Nitrospirae bacterium]|nr:MAG: hypothetical protein E6K66_09190 [Nitrospirota bacterium]